MEKSQIDYDKVALAVAKIEEKRAKAAANLPTPKPTPIRNTRTASDIASDTSRRQHVKRITFGCSGFGHHAFHNGQ